MIEDSPDRTEFVAFDTANLASAATATCFAVGSFGQHGNALFATTWSRFELHKERGSAMEGRWRMAQPNKRAETAGYDMQRIMIL